MGNSRRAKEEAERKEKHERQVKADASRAKKKAEELKKKVGLCMYDMRGAAACIHSCSCCKLSHVGCHCAALS